MLGLALSGCADILDETPRSKYTPEFFKTADGVRGGITALYGNLRIIWGDGYWLNAMETGTDEYTYGHGGDQNYLVMDMSGQGNLTPESSRSDRLWNSAYSDINTANGILENGANVEGISESLLAEANFFRAFDYFCLVQTFGGVPLDLGAGDLKFNTSTVRTSKRNTVPEVYTKCIFPDLKHAVDMLPETGRVTGGVTKTAARLFLSKAYLTYAWWLQNPNDIPTYPECERIDPDGHDASWYFQQSYDTAVEAIRNPANFGLMESFYQVNAGQYDRNKECVLYADHTQSSTYYDGNTNHDWANGNAPGNYARWMVRWDYTFLQSSTSSSEWSAVNTVQREAVQGKDRPWKCMAPPIEVTTKLFKDKVHDSRYDGTFVTKFLGNWDRAGIENSVLYNANYMPVKPGEAILTFLDEDDPNVVYPSANQGDAEYNKGAGRSNVGAGWIDRKSVV